MRVARHCRTILAAAALAAAVGCHEKADSDKDAGDAASPDAGPPDAVVNDAAVDARLDASPDASTDASVIQHYFCNEPFFKLPIDGQTEATHSIEIDRGRVLWTRNGSGSTYSAGEMFLLDLETCIERQLTQGSKAGRAHLVGNHLVWDDRKDEDGQWCTDLYHMDLSTGITDRMTQTPGCELDPRTNGRFVAYSWVDTLDGPPTVPPTLRLLDMDTGDDIELWRGSVSSFDLDERYVVWPGYGPDPQSVGRDIYVHDLESGETSHLDFTYERYQWWVFIWQGWVTIRGTDNGLYDPLNFLQLYHLETQELRTILVDDYATSAAWIKDGLLAYNTSQYSVQPALNPSDLEVYEIDTAESRRITQTESNLRAFGVSSPFILILKELFNPNSYMNDFYIANLEALGVLDASGILIPGDPVIDPP